MSTDCPEKPTRIPWEDEIGGDCHCPKPNTIELDPTGSYSLIGNHLVQLSGATAVAAWGLLESELEDDGVNWNILRPCCKADIVLPKAAAFGSTVTELIEAMAPLGWQIGP